MIFPSLRFQVWRLENNFFNLIGSSDITAPLSVSHTFPSGAMIYTLTVEPITVQSGDIFGMFILPTAPDDNGTISPHFLNGAGNSMTFFQTILTSTDVEQTTIDQSILGLSTADSVPLVNVVILNCKLKQVILQNLQASCHFEKHVKQKG